MFEEKTFQSCIIQTEQYIIYKNQQQFGNINRLKNDKIE